MKQKRQKQPKLLLSMEVNTHGNGVNLKEIWGIMATQTEWENIAGHGVFHLFADGTLEYRSLDNDK